MMLAHRDLKGKPGGHALVMSPSMLSVGARGSKAEASPHSTMEGFATAMPKLSPAASTFEIAKAHQQAAAEAGETRQAIRSKLNNMVKHRKAIALIE